MDTEKAKQARQRAKDLLKEINDYGKPPIEERWVSFKLTLHLMLEAALWKAKEFPLFAKDLVSELERLISSLEEGVGMRAMKCDRCKKLYEAYDGKKMFEDRGCANAFVLIDRDLNKNCWNKASYDLCPECMEELQGFLITVEREEKA